MGRAVDFLTDGSPWVITQDWYEKILSIAQREGDIEAALKESGGRLENSIRVEQHGGVAVMYVKGPMFPYANLFDQVSGAMSVEMLIKELGVIERNADIHSAVIAWDTPGGHVTLINEFSKHIYNFSKPIVSYVTGSMTSGGYWAGSAAKKIVMDETAVVGSIGVVIGFRNTDTGVIELVSSNAPDKRPAIETDEGRRVVQKYIDDTEAVFIEKVMEYRGMSREQVIGLRGGVLIGAKAIEAGFANEIGSLESVIKQLNEEYSMDLDTLKADHPEVYQAAVDVGKKEVQTSFEQQVSDANNQVVESKKAERKRFNDILTCEEAKGRSQLAMHIAGSTEMSVDEAKKLLAASPTQTSKTAFDALDAEMSDSNPTVGADDTDSVALDADEKWAQEFSAANKSA